MNKKEELIIATTFRKLGMDQNMIQENSDSNLFYYYDKFFDGIIEFLTSKSKDKIKLQKADLPVRLRTKWNKIFPKRFHSNQIICIDRSNEDIDELIISFGTFEKIWKCEVDHLHLKVKSNLVFFNKHWSIDDFRVDDDHFDFEKKFHFKKELIQLSQLRQDQNDISEGSIREVFEKVKVKSESELSLVLLRVVENHFEEDNFYVSMTLSTILKLTDKNHTYTRVLFVILMNNILNPKTVYGIKDNRQDGDIGFLLLQFVFSKEFKRMLERDINIPKTYFLKIMNTKYEKIFMRIRSKYFAPESDIFGIELNMLDYQLFGSSNSAKIKLFYSTNEEQPSDLETLELVDSLNFSEINFLSISTSDNFLDHGVKDVNYIYDLISGVVNCLGKEFKEKLKAGIIIKKIEFAASQFCIYSKSPRYSMYLKSKEIIDKYGREDIGIKKQVIDILFDQKRTEAIDSFLNEANFEEHEMYLKMYGFSRVSYKNRELWKAIKYIDKALYYFPYSFQLNFFKANLKIEVKKYKEALTSLEICKKIAPGNPKIFSRIISCHIKLNNLDEARASLKGIMEKMDYFDGDIEDLRVQLLRS